ncbi:YwiC-like protein [Krasilnikovia cinnamomea]|uniref:YwiC-like protein n=1 Tax=Krasilnikovia cinnamomea TaxID=349313 RepID=A0A4V2G7V8_9ACTN|nr:YwiC-like family protein [Krasilnikovia cinnamomea]RZU54106.1 YwiC-like protein [Krasilnikovia cinnamomea]
MSATDLARPRAPKRRRSVRRFVAPQHGAWAMLLVPYLVGVLAAGFRWPHVPLLGAWLAGYLLSYYALQAVKTGRPRRFRAQLLLYAPITALLGAVVVVARPQVLLYAPVYALLLAVNAAYARRRDERALVNDLVSVVQSCLMVFVAATVAGVAPSRVSVAFGAVLLYFAGTVFYVKTMIRERGSASHYRLSVGYHVAAVAVAAWLAWPLSVFFAALAVRAWALPARRLRPVHVGLVEIAACVLLVTTILVAEA